VWLFEFFMFLMGLKTIDCFFSVLQVLFVHLVLCNLVRKLFGTKVNLFLLEKKQEQNRNLFPQKNIFFTTPTITLKVLGFRLDDTDVLCSNGFSSLHGCLRSEYNIFGAFRQRQIIDSHKSTFQNTVGPRFIFSLFPYNVSTFLGVSVDHFFLSLPMSCSPSHMLQPPQVSFQSNMCAKNFCYPFQGQLPLLVVVNDGERSSMPCQHSDFILTP